MSTELRERFRKMQREAGLIMSLTETDLAVRLAVEAVEAERERWAGDARLAAYIREHAEQSADGWRVDVWINGAPSQQTIDEAIRQRGKQ